MAGCLVGWLFCWSGCLQ